jgi:hypothetical protein
MPSGSNPKSKANLKPAHKGEVRNPTGINRKRPYTDRHYEKAESLYPEKLRLKANKNAGTEILPPGATWADAEIVQAHMGAAKGGVAQLREITDRIEGSPPKRLEITGTEHKVVTLEVIFRKRIIQSSSE